MESIDVEGLNLLDQLCWELIYAQAQPLDAIAGREAELVERVVSILTGPIPPELGELLEHAPVFGKKVEFLRAYLTTAVLSLEFQSVKALLCDTPFECMYLERVADHVVREGEAAGIGANSHVLFIGCGPFPESAVGLVRGFGCQVTCIDHNADAIFCAHLVVKRLGLERLMEVKLADGRDVDSSAFSHVWLASLVSEKEEILGHLYEQGIAGVRVVLRYGTGLKRLFNYEAPPFDPKLWRPINWSALEHFYEVLILEKCA